MRWFKLKDLSKVILCWIFVGCAKELPPRDLVQTNIVKKEIFKDVWWYKSTVINVDYDFRALSYPGDTSYDLAGDVLTIQRIRWVIDKDFLYAFRAYELTEGANKDATRKDYRGEPVAAFRIESHFDIMRQYNPTTGEEYNVIAENTTERPWYERKYMRVNWSQNYVNSFSKSVYEIYSDAGLIIKKESTPFFIQEGSEFPEEWLPTFEYASLEKDDEWAPQYKPGTLYYMSFVTQEVYTPTKIINPFTRRPILACLLYTNLPCTANLITRRHAFLKIPERHEYQPLNYSDTRFEKFGFFRLERQTYQRSQPSEKEGLTPHRGETLFKNYAIMRYNIWKEHWKKDASGQFLKDEEGNLLPIPLSKRQPRTITHYLTPNFPKHLILPAFQLMAEWNQIFMEMVRELKQEPVPSTYDPFMPPGKEENTYDCWVADLSDPENPKPYSDPEHPKYEEDFHSALWLEFVGDECILTLKVNPCDRDPQKPCKQRGDLRYRFISYIDFSDPFFLGISTVRADPLTGEIITGDSNIAGSILNKYRTFALQTYDLMAGTLDEYEFIAGENIREYFENLNKIDRPAIPRVDYLQLSSPGKIEKWIDQRMDLLSNRLELLRGEEAKSKIERYTNRFFNLANTPWEKRLVQNDESFLLGEFSFIPQQTLHPNEELLEKISLFRNSPAQFLKKIQEKDRELLIHNITLPTIYEDWSVYHFVQENRHLSRQEIVFKIDRLLFRNNMLHEMGHTLGLRHNFAGSIDVRNFKNPYFEIIDRLPLPGWGKERDPRGENCNDWYPNASWIEKLEPCEEACDKIYGNQDGVCDALEATRVNQAWKEVQIEREKQGIKKWMTASIMDYTAGWYSRLVGLGPYERAAIKFGYGELSEVYQISEATLQEPRPDQTKKIIWGYYEGGGTCASDKDCPYHLGSGNLRPGQAIGQRCIPHPRLNNQKICSEFYQDMDKYVNTTSKDNIKYAPVKYQFCSDERMRDLTLSWCNIFDEGATLREVVQNARGQYHRAYIFRNFRRYRKNFPAGYPRWLIRFYVNLLKVFQHLIYRYHLEPDFKNTRGPLGFYDHYLAAVDVMNLFSEIIAQPAKGKYFFSEKTGTFCRPSYWTPWCGLGQGPEESLPIELGLGKYIWSDYQRTMRGFSRWERIGIIYDKIYAMLIMSIRDWGIPYTIDERYFVNMYDLFPNEVRRLFGGLLQSEPQKYAPRIRLDEEGNPYLVYMNLWEGWCNRDPEQTECQPFWEDMYSDLPVLDGASNILIRLYATIISLAFFPVYFDPAFEEEIYLCIEGHGECFDIKEEMVEGEDYARYTSKRLNRTYLAVNINPKEEGGGSLAFEMVKKAYTLQKELDEFPPESTWPSSPSEWRKMRAEKMRLEREIRNMENFFQQLIDLQRFFGVSNYFIRRR